MKLDDDIHNYYEKLLLDHLVELRLDDEYDTEYLADLCCIVPVSYTHLTLPTKA